MAASSIALPATACSIPARSFCGSNGTSAPERFTTTSGSSSTRS